MAHKISIGIDWQGKLDYKALCEKVRIADAVGVHSAWVPEAWGRDAFTILTLLADKTQAYQSRHGDCEYLLTHSRRACPALCHPG